MDVGKNLLTLIVFFNLLTYRNQQNVGKR